MRFLKVIITGCLVLIQITAVSAQDIAVRTEYPRVVSVGEQIRLVYTVNTSGGDLEAPSFEGFYKLSGPNVSYSMSTQIVNGRRTSETSYSYVFYLQATREGKFTIAPAKYTKDRKDYFSEQVDIEVISDKGTAVARPGETRPAESQGETGGDDMFVRILLDKREVYAGEPVVATVKFFTRTDIAGISEIKYPSFNGFLKEEIETPQPTSLERENIDGAIYGTAVFQRFLLYPQRSGEIVIDPVQMTVLIRQRSGASDPIFGDFFQSFTNVPRTLASASRTIVVRPLPAGRPEGFPGAVGNFTISVSADRDSLGVNDALNLKVTISGQGNFRLTDAPVIAFPAGLEVYDPKTTTNVTNRTDGTSGSRVFEYLIIPRSPGDYTIPAVSWSFFDPAPGSYRTISAPPVKFTVSKSSGGQGGPQIFTPATSEEIQYLGSDIRYIITDTPALRKTVRPLMSARSYFAAYGLTLLLFAVVVILRREQVRRNADRARVLNKRAGRVARRRLDSALRNLEKGNTDKFYEELLRALWGYVSDKTNLPFSGLSADTATEALTARGAEKALAGELIELAGTCEQVRYSPVSSSAGPAGLHRKALSIIRELENQLK